MVNEIEETSLGYLLSPEFELINSAGKPLTGGWIEVYIHGTRNKYYCYSDWNGTLHPFKIPLDSLGANIVLASPAHSFDVYVYNKFGTLVMSRYNVLPQIAGTAVISGSVNIESSDGTIQVEVTGDNNFDISIADIIDSVTANIDESITNINNEITQITQVVTGLPTHADVYDSIVTGIEYVTGMIPEAQVQSDWDETNPSNPAYILNKPDLDNYVTEQELIEVVSGISGFNLEYGQFYCQTTTGGAVMGRTKGNIDVTNDGKIKLKKGQSYHVTVRGGYSKATASAEYNVLSYIEYITGQNINVNVDNSVTDTQYFEISYDLYKLSSDKDYYVFFSLPTGSSVNNLFIEIHSIGCMGTGGSGSGVPVEYDAGWGINIVDNVISVDPSILNQYVTEGELATAIDNVIDIVTGLIPEAQVQADWDEDNPLDPSYINNKPDLDNFVTDQELIEAISGVTGTNFQNVVEYVDAQTTPNFFNDCVALLEQGIEPVAKYQGNVYQLWRSETNGLTYTALGFICVNYLDFQYGNISYDHQNAYNMQLWAEPNGVYPGADRMGYNYLAGNGIDAVTGIVNNEHAITYSINPMEVATAVSGLIPTGSNYSAGDNIVIDDNTISLSDVVTINAREGQSSGFMAFGNITHWGDQDYGPGWTISAHTDRGVDYHSYNTCDQGTQAFFWGDYEHDRATGSVSGQSLLLISEGDITYASGAFQDTSTLPVIWSCSQMAQDISELQEAITAVTGTTVNNVIDYDDPDLYNKVTAVIAAGGAPVVKHTATDTTFYFSDLEVIYDLQSQSVSTYMFFLNNVSGGTYNRQYYAYTQTMYIWPDGRKTISYNYPEYSIKAGNGIDAVTGTTGATFNIDAMEVATAISGLLPTGPTYSAGDGIDITNNTISVDNTVALKSEIPDVSNFVTEAEVSGMIPDVSNLVSDDELTAAVSGKSDKFVVLEYQGSYTWDYVQGLVDNNILVYCKYNNTMCVLTDVPSSNAGFFTFNGYKVKEHSASKLTDEVIKLKFGRTFTLMQPTWFMSTTKVAAEVLPGTGLTGSYNSTSDIYRISINPEQIAGAISGLLPEGPTYYAGNGIDITNDTISVDNTVALKTDIPDVSDFVTSEELQDGLELVTGLIPTDYATPADVQDAVELVTGLIPADYVTNEELQDGLELVTGLIPSDYVTNEQLQDSVELVTGLIPTDYATKEELQDNIELATGMIPNYTAGDNIDITNNVISVSGTEDLTLMNLTAGEGITITPDVSGNVEIACTSTGVTKTLLYTGSSTDSRSGTFTLSQSGYNFDRLEMTLIDVNNYVIKQVCEMPADGLVGVNGTRGSSFNSITIGTQTWFKAMNWQLNYAGTTLTYWVDEIATSGNSVIAINRNQTANRPIMLRIYGIKE